jgi:hypothetical protein
MAEFCKQCAEELGFSADFTGLFTRDGGKPDPTHQTGYPVLCETCGPSCFIIDDEGTCGASHCDSNHYEKLVNEELTTLAAARRLLNPLWMEFGYQALSNHPRPDDSSIVFSFMGGGGSDNTTFADFVRVMGDPWETVKKMNQERE